MREKEKKNSEQSEAVLYTTDCILCKALKQKLDNAGIVYIKVSDELIMIAKGFDTVPILEVNGEIYDYKNAIKWIETRGNCNEQ